MGLPTPDNRMVATPYTKRMTAFPDVDMAAGHLLVTNGLADELGIDPARRVHLRGWGFARDATSVGARADLASSPAMAAATTDALDGAGIGIDDVDCFDLYSCFGSAVQFALDALGLDAADPRPLTLTGGLPYHGGPGSNYLSHSISHLVDRLRRGDATIGMVTGVGMHLTKHVAAVWSSAPGPTPPTPPDTDATLARVRAAHPDTPVLDRHDGPAGVVAACVVHGRDGHPDHAVAICEAPGGGRCYARSEDPDVLAAVAADAWLDRKAVLGPGPRSTNAFTF
jgi:acetyl-CoA C-acetyltransferase